MREDDDEDCSQLGEDASLLRAVAFVPELSVAPTPPPLAGEDPFTGNARFAIEARLGAGGFGVVYRVFDRERGVSLALKALRDTQPRWLRWFKREFRLLAGVVHPNLVTLYDLFVE